LSQEEPESGQEIEGSVPTHDMRVGTRVLSFNKKNKVSLHRNPVGKMLNEHNAELRVLGEKPETKIKNAKIITASDVFKHYDAEGKETLRDSLTKSLKEGGLLIVKTDYHYFRKELRAIDVYQKKNGQLTYLGSLVSNDDGNLYNNVEFDLSKWLHGDDDPTRENLLGQEIRYLFNEISPGPGVATKRDRAMFNKKAEENWEKHIETPSREMGPIPDERLTDLTLYYEQNVENNISIWFLRDAHGKTEARAYVEEHEGFINILNIGSRDKQGAGEELLKQLMEKFGKPIQITDAIEENMISSDALRMTARMKAKGYQVTPLKDLPILHGTSWGRENITGEALYSIRIDKPEDHAMLTTMTGEELTEFIKNDLYQLETLMEGRITGNEITVVKVMEDEEEDEETFEFHSIGKLEEILEELDDNDDVESVNVTYAAIEFVNNKTIELSVAPSGKVNIEIRDFEAITGQTDLENSVLEILKTERDTAEVPKDDPTPLPKDEPTPLPKDTPMPLPKDEPTPRPKDKLTSPKTPKEPKATWDRFEKAKGTSTVITRRVGDRKVIRIEKQPGDIRPVYLRSSKRIDKAMLTEIENILKTELKFPSQITKARLQEKISEFNSGSLSDEERNRINRALASVVIHGLPETESKEFATEELLTEVEIGGVSTSSVADVTLNWQTQEDRSLKLVGGEFNVGGGGINQAKAITNQGESFGLVTFLNGGPVSEAFRTKISNPLLASFFSGDSKGEQRVNIFHNVDNEVLPIMIGRGEEITDEVIEAFLASMRSMISQAPNLKWIGITANRPLRYDNIHEVQAATINEAHKHGIQVMIDIRRDSSIKKDVEAVLQIDRETPQDIFGINISEFIFTLEVLGIVDAGKLSKKTMTEDEIVRYSNKLISDFNLIGVLVTRDRNGLIFTSHDGDVIKEPGIPIKADADTGSGDAAKAGFMLALAEGKSFVDAARQANIYGAATAMLPGTQVATPESLLEAERLRDDSAMFTETKKEIGGIDFNPTDLDIETRGEDIDFGTPVNIQNLENMQIEGFTPVIFQIIPVTNIPLLLGAEESNEAQEPLALLVR